MITYVFFKGIFSIVTFLLAYTLDIVVEWIPGFSATAFPVLFGFDTDAALATGWGYFHFVAYKIPPLGIMYEGFLWILYFKIAMIFLTILRLLPAYFSGHSINK